MLDGLVDPLPPPKFKGMREVVQKPVVVHQEVVLWRPEHNSAEQRVDWGTQMYLDRGLQQQEGTGGYVVWD